MATATFTEVVDRAIGQALEEAIWDDQIKDNVNQLAGAHRNLLVNGAFEVWQRGTSGFTTPLGMYTADMWRYVDAGGSGTIAITRESSTKLAASTYALKAVYTKVAVNSQLTQRIENVAELRGRYLSLSVWVHQSVASGCRPFIADSAGTTYGSAVATTGSFVLLTVTRTVDSAATTLDAGVEFQSSGTYYLDNAMLSLSPVPAPFRPLHPQEELARCQRYYEVHGGR